MGDIKASPRNKVLGLLADYGQAASDFVSKPFGYDNPPVAMLMNSGPNGLLRTINELSYGGALGTGSGMTWKPKADTVDALMTAAPMAMSAGKMAIDGGVALAKKAAPAIERAVPRVMESGGLGAGLLRDLSPSSRSWAIDPKEYGLPVNPDGSVSLLHGTTKNSARQIIATGRLKSAGEPDVYLTTSPNAGYGDGTVVQVNVDPKKLFIDDEFPDGRFDFRLPAPSGQAAVKKPTLFSGDPSLSPPPSKTVSIPVAPEYFGAVGAEPRKMLADVGRLLEKHPKDFSSMDAVESHLNHAYGAKPELVVQASDPRYTLTGTSVGNFPNPAGQEYRAVVSDLRGQNGGNYQVISAFPMTEKQKLKKGLLGKE